MVCNYSGVLQSLQDKYSRAMTPEEELIHQRQEKQVLRERASLQQAVIDQQQLLIEGLQQQVELLLDIQTVMIKLMIVYHRLFFLLYWRFVPRRLTCLSRSAAPACVRSGLLCWNSGVGLMVWHAEAR